MNPMSTRRLVAVLINSYVWGGDDKFAICVQSVLLYGCRVGVGIPIMFSMDFL